MVLKSRPERVREVFAEAAELCERKHLDYGDSVTEHGAVGVLIRIQDKLNRTKTVTRASIAYVDDESIRDTLIDMANYAAMAVTLLDEERARQSADRAD